MTKTVALSDAAYATLARLKRPGQSFSEVVQELAAARRPSVREVAGTLAADSKRWAEFAAERRRARRLTTSRAAFDEE